MLYYLRFGSNILDLRFWRTQSYNSLEQFPFNLFLPKLPPYHSCYVFYLSSHTYKMQIIQLLIQFMSRPFYSGFNLNTLFLSNSFCNNHLHASQTWYNPHLFLSKTRAWRFRMLTSYNHLCQFAILSFYTCLLSDVY